MGQFSWLDCITNEQIIDNKQRDVFVLVPAVFGGGHIHEWCYDGYGNFNGNDIYALVANWNCPELCNGDIDHDRTIGIDIACYDEDNAGLKYPIKITHDKDAIYEECNFSPADPNQGWEVEKEYLYTFKYNICSGELCEAGTFETEAYSYEEAQYNFWDYMEESRDWSEYDENIFDDIEYFWFEEEVEL